MGGADALDEGRPSFISLSGIDLLPCDASKSAAFHQFCALTLLTTLQIMMYREELMLGAYATPLDEFEAMHVCFAPRSAEKKAVFEQLVDEKIRPPVVRRNAACHRFTAQN